MVEFLVFFVEIFYVKKDLFMDYDDFLMDKGHVDLTVLLFVCFGIFGMDYTMEIEVMWFKVTNWCSLDTYSFIHTLLSLGPYIYVCSHKSPEYVML